jgi:hypothetical protein
LIKLGSEREKEVGEDGGGGEWKIRGDGRKFEKN